MRTFSRTAWSFSSGAFLLLSLTTTALSGCAVASEDEESGMTEGAFASGFDDSTVKTRVAGTGGSGVRVRAEPRSTSAALDAISEGVSIEVKCKVKGESVGGNTFWDYLPKYRGYISDKYVAKSGRGTIKTCDESDTTQAPGTTGTSPPPAARPVTSPAATGDALADALVNEARKWIGTRDTNNCNPFSSALGRPCEAWCADFVQYVWAQSSLSTDGITAYAGSFLSYGSQVGTLKARNSPDVRPGDAIVWAVTATNAAHVGMVTEVLGNGQIRVINGNWGDAVQEVTTNVNSVVGGMGIAGFVSPAPR